MDTVFFRNIPTSGPSKPTHTLQDYPKYPKYDPTADNFIEKILSKKGYLPKTANEAMFLIV